MTEKIVSQTEESIFTSSADSSSEEEPSSIFGITEEKEERKLSTEEVNRQAMFAALSDIDVQGEDPSTVLGLLKETKRMHEDQIKAVGLSHLRRQKSYENRAQEVKSLVKLSREDFTSQEEAELAPFITQAASEAARTPVEDRDGYALEKSVADSIQDLALKYPKQQHIFDKHLQHDGTMDAMADYVAKNLIIEEAIKDIGAEERHILHKFWDGLVDFAIFTDTGTSSTGNVEKREALQKMGDFFLPGVQLEKEAHKLHSMSLKEFKKAFPEVLEMTRRNASVFGRLNEGEQVKLLRELQSTPSAVSKNTWNALELSVLVPFSKGTTVTKSLLRSGAREEATQVQSVVLREAAEEGLETAASKVGMTADEVVENSLPSSLRLESDDMVVGISTDASSAYESGKSLIKEYMELNASGRLLPDEQKAAQASLRSRMERRVSHPIKDQKILRENLSDGSILETTELVLGSSRGSGGFSSKKSAAKALKAQQLPGEVFKDASGQWFVKVRSPVQEEGFYVQGANPSNHLNFMRYLLGGANQGDVRLSGAAQQAGRAQQKITKMYEQIWARAAVRLNSKQRKTFNEVLEKNSDDVKWLSPDELSEVWFKQTGEEVPPKVQQAYFDYRRVHDAEYVFRNDDIYRSLHLQGYNTISAGNIFKGRNAKVSQELPSSLKGEAERFHDVTRNATSSPGHKISPEYSAEMSRNKYIRVTTEEAVEVSPGVWTNKFVGKKQDFQIQDLERLQLPYRAGPHRMYQPNSYFSKTATRLTQKDTGETMLSHPKAWRVFPSRLQAKKWNDTMNEARLAALAPTKNSRSLDEILEGDAFPTPEEFLADVKKGRITLEDEFETVLDRSLPSAYVKTPASQKFSQETADNGLQTFGRTTGRMYYSKKGDRLKGYDGRPAPILNPSETIQAAVDNVSRLGAFGNYKLQAANRFLTTFEKFMDPASLQKGASPLAKVQTGVLREDAKKAMPSLQSTFDTQKAIVGRVLNWETATDRGLSTFQRQLDRALEKTELGVKASNWARESNPFNALRGFAFHTKLGMFNVGQFVLQSSTSVQAALLSPNYVKINPLQAYASGVVMRFVAEYPKNPVALAKNSSLRKTLGFKTEEDFAEMILAYKNSGWGNVDNSHLLMNSGAGEGLAGKVGAGAGFERFKKGSSFFFTEAERWNRAVAFTVAWREAREKALTHLKHKPSRKDPDFMNEVMHKTDVYSFQMTQESRAAWQKGFASIPTQFFSYQSRMVELLFGKSLTGNQKIKLAAGQTLMYGSAGVVGVGMVSDAFQDASGKPFEEGTLPWVLDRGLWDSLIHFSTGSNVGVSDRIGVGNFFPDLIGEFMDKSDYGNVSPSDMAGGASFQIATETYKDIKDVFRYSLASEGKLGDPLTKKALVDLSKNITSLSYAMKVKTALQYQTLYSNSGTLLSDEITSPQTFFLMLGIAPGDLQKTEHGMAFLQDEKEDVKELSTLLNKLKTQWVFAPDEREGISAQINSLQHISDPYLWKKAREQAERFPNNKSLNESIAEAVRKEKAKKEMNERILSVVNNKDN